MTQAIPETFYEAGTSQTWELTLPEDEAGCCWETCARAAEWHGRHLCCGYTALVCASHRQQFEEMVAAAKSYDCAWCFEVAFIVRWHCI